MGGLSSKSWRRGRGYECGRNALCIRIEFSMNKWNWILKMLVAYVNIETKDTLIWGGVEKIYSRICVIFNSNSFSLPIQRKNLSRFFCHFHLKLISCFLFFSHKSTWQTCRDGCFVFLSALRCRISQSLRSKLQGDLTNTASSLQTQLWHFRSSQDRSLSLQHNAS